MTDTIQAALNTAVLVCAVAAMLWGGGQPFHYVLAAWAGILAVGLIRATLDRGDK